MSDFQTIALDSSTTLETTNETNQSTAVSFCKDLRELYEKYGVIKWTVGVIYFEDGTTLSNKLAAKHALGQINYTDQ